MFGTTFANNPTMINDILQVSSAPHVDGRGQVVDSTCAALLPSTSQFQVLRAMADEGVYPWMSKNHHGFFVARPCWILSHH